MMIYCGTSHIIRTNTLLRLQQGHFKFFSDENNLIGECIFLINVKVYLCRCCTSFVEILQVLPKNHCDAGVGAHCLYIYIYIYIYILICFGRNMYWYLGLCKFKRGDT